jgi:hypothetical protein
MASSNYAREVQEPLRLKSFGRDSVHNVGNWPAMGGRVRVQGHS